MPVLEAPSVVLDNACRLAYNRNPSITDQNSQSALNVGSEELYLYIRQLEERQRQDLELELKVATMMKRRPS